MADIHASIHQMYWRDWRKALKKYLKNTKDFHNAIRFLELHPANQRLKWGPPDEWFHENLWWAVVKVDPKTKRIETKKNKNWRKNKKGKFPNDKKRNTETNVWVEWGPYNEHDTTFGSDGVSSHDMRVDTGGKTFEEAIVNLAHNIWLLYGDNKDAPDDAKLAKKDRW